MRVRDENTGKLLGACCPGLGSPGHGSWYFNADLPSAAGERRRVRRGGFTTRAAAVAALEALAFPAAAREPGLSTGEWLGRWLASRVSLRPSTLHRIHATLRAALNGAVRAGLIAVNPGRFPELPKGITTPMMTPVGEQRVDLGMTEVWLSNATLVERRQHEGRMHYAFTTPDRTVRYRRPAEPLST